MAEIVNLRRAKKARARTQADATSAANRAKHGQTRAQRDHTAAETRLADRRLNAAELARDGEPRE